MWLFSLQVEVLGFHTFFVRNILYLKESLGLRLHNLIRMVTIEYERLPVENINYNGLMDVFTRRMLILI